MVLTSKVIGGYLCSIALIIEAVLQKFYLGTSYLPGLNAAVAFFFIFILFYGSTVDCAAYVYVSEIWPTHLRSQGGTIAFVSYYLCAMAYNSPASLAFGTIGWKYYLVFIIVCVLSTTVILFYFPEVSPPEKLALADRKDRWAYS
jgi:hypothetical protein